MYFCDICLNWYHALYIEECTAIYITISVYRLCHGFVSFLQLIYSTFFYCIVDNESLTELFLDFNMRNKYSHSFLEQRDKYIFSRVRFISHTFTNKYDKLGDQYF